MGTYIVEMIIDTDGDDRATAVKEAIEELVDYEVGQNAAGVARAGIKFLGLEEIEVSREDEEEADEDEDEDEDEEGGDDGDA